VFSINSDRWKGWGQATGHGQCLVFLSVLWQCLLDGRKDILPVKTTCVVYPRVFLVKQKTCLSVKQAAIRMKVVRYECFLSLHAWNVFGLPFCDHTTCCILQLTLPAVLQPLVMFCIPLTPHYLTVLTDSLTVGLRLHPPCWLCNFRLLLMFFVVWYKWYWQIIHRSKLWYVGNKVCDQQRGSRTGNSNAC